MTWNSKEEEVWARIHHPQMAELYDRYCHHYKENDLPYKTWEEFLDEPVFITYSNAHRLISEDIPYKDPTMDPLDYWLILEVQRLSFLRSLESPKDPLDGPGPISIVKITKPSE